MKIYDLLKLSASILVCLFAGFIGSIYTTPQIKGWYMALNKPFLNPPSWVFAPVWTTLYIMMGIALFLVWSKQGKKAKTAITVFFVQLLLNTLWSVIFFNLHMLLGAFFWLILLWASIALNIYLFNKYSKTAAYLLVPYIMWVSFAGYLNLALFLVNR
jgi:benzodiazapine receptor